MKKIEIIKQEFPIDYVFTSKEFEQLMHDEESMIEFIHSLGFFHDGQDITDISINPYTFDKYKDIYPYVVWRIL